MNYVNTRKPSQRMKIPRQRSIEQLALERVTNFSEVSFGLDEQRAEIEASRCLECANPLCVGGCPVGIDIKGFIQLILLGDYSGAAEKIKDANYFPSICGRVCPQESQCEAECTLGKKYPPVAIGKLERFVADYEIKHNHFSTPVISSGRSETVAVIGSGPAGMTCAVELAKLGYKVTIFEALHTVGGVLQYGIPEFRLPRYIIEIEVERMKMLGIEICTNFVVGRTATIDELLSEWKFDAIFLGTGAGTPIFMGIPGEHLSGVYSANEFLTRVNLMKAYRFPEYDTPVKIGRDVAVIGGGNTAMDAVRTARRLGAERAYLVYRRSRHEMPAREEEIHHAEEEGVSFLFLTNPIMIIDNGNGLVGGIECQRMELGNPDQSGRRIPIPIAGSEYVIPVETVIEAIGQTPNPIIQSTTKGLATGNRGTVVIYDGQRTSRENIFAGGDLTRGGATVILAMSDGKNAALTIHKYLLSKCDGGS